MADYSGMSEAQLKQLAAGGQRYRDPNDSWGTLSRSNFDLSSPRYLTSGPDSQAIAELQRRADAQIAEQQRQTISRLMEQADPFRDQRAQYQGQLRDLLTNPSAALESNPFFKASGEAGQEAAMRRLRQMGMGGSGNAAFELQRQAQANMSDDFFKMGSMLGKFAGAEADPAGGARAAIDAMKEFGLERRFDLGKERAGVLQLHGGQHVDTRPYRPGLSSLGTYWGQ